ncbi:MAG: rod shape-determining protein RodA [Bacteriovoracaceae bacterium]|nr:rod shape-determining protein RodA [Bacteriovoracaceae bacterium]
MKTSGILGILQRYDFSFFIISILIFLVGILNLYSATHTTTVSWLQGVYKVQILFFLFSVFVAAMVSFISPKIFFKLALPAYLVNTLLLVAVLILGHKGMGAQRWLVIGPARIQPSELMKISIILMLAKWYAKHGPVNELGLKELIVPFIMVFLPTILIIMEPDLGTGLILMLIFGVISFYRKLKWKTIFIIGLITIVSGSVMYKFGLKAYQRRRILTFLNPDADTRGSGYNAIQSKIAIGSGKASGKGFMKSSQASFNYLPEKHTDFVFSIFNEEHGFIGSFFLICLYLVLMLRLIWLATAVNSFFDSIICVGVMSLFFWHTFINMGMVMGVLPIVGLPLPYMSYGGSGLLTFGICIGIVTSISNSRKFF